MALVSLRCVSKDARSSGGAFCFATSGGVLSFFVACTTGAGGGTFAAEGVGLASRGRVGALVDGVAGALAGSTVAAPLCGAVGAGGLDGAAGWATDATVSALVGGAAVGDGATEGGGFTLAQPAVRSTKRSPRTSATRINGFCVRISTQRSFIGFSSVNFHRNQTNCKLINHENGSGWVVVNEDRNPTPTKGAPRQRITG